uniref:IS200/IS605 family transposase n=4 Tax=unclassified Prevotella TaxID=2638335 RepID=A0AB33JKE5_9BACT
MAYTKLLYHIVFSTKQRQPTIVLEYERELYAYIMGIIAQAEGHLYRIGGMPDHIHIIADIPSKISLSDFVKRLKQGSSNWLAANPHFPHWNRWEESYGAFTYAYNDLQEVVDYVRNQKEHHKKVSFTEEYRKLLDDFGIEYDERYIPK